MDVDGGTIATVGTALGLGTALGAWVKSRIARTQTTDTKLWAWVARLEADNRAEREKCDSRIALVEAKATAAEARADAAEQKAAALAAELREVRRAIGMQREDDTPLVGRQRKDST